jgi:glycosyltransferase involved in cell wall biosynthesis
MLTRPEIDPCDQPVVGRARPTVVTLLGAYLPGYKAGGPIRSIENAVAALCGEVHFKIVTLDRDLGDELPFPGIAVNRWTRVGDADVMYQRPGLRGVLRTLALLCSVDRKTVVYLNSFFARRFSMLAVLALRLRLCRPLCLVLAPRGELSTGTMQFKRRRKLLYMRIARWLGLYRDIIWQASSDFEAADIRRYFPRVQCDAAGVLPGSNMNDGKTPTNIVLVASDLVRPGHLRVVFVSRVSRPKNLLGALQILGGVSGDVAFDIYGPVEDAEYWRECQCAIAALPANVRVQYRGEVEHDKIWKVFSNYHLFLLPTWAENFGHVICEALAAGCPVLISDQTPWRNLETEGVGWDIPIAKTEAFQTVLQHCVDGDDEWHTALSMRAIDYATKRASDPEIIGANRRLFRSAFSWPELHVPAWPATPEQRQG